MSVLEGQGTCEQALRYLASLDASNTAESVGQEITRIEETSRRESEDCRQSVLLRSGDAYSRIGQEDPLGRELEAKYSLLGLSSGSIDLEMEVDLVEHLKSGLPVGVGGEVTRRHFAEYWVAAWLRMRAETIPNYNFENSPSLNVEPPPGGPAIAGMSPENIKNPGRRREYETMIAANNAKISRSNTQVFLRRETPVFTSQVEHSFRSSFDSRDIGEVQELLASLHGDLESLRIIALVANHGTA